MPDTLVRERRFRPQPLSPPLSPAERASLLLRTCTMSEIRDAAEWLGCSFNAAYQERAAVFRDRYPTLAR